MSSSVVSKLPFKLNFVKNLVKCIFKERDTINFKNLFFKGATRRIPIGHLRSGQIFLSWTRLHLALFYSSNRKRSKINWFWSDPFWLFWGKQMLFSFWFMKYLSVKKQVWLGVQRHYDRKYHFIPNLSHRITKSFVCLFVCLFLRFQLY